MPVTMNLSFVRAAVGVALCLAGPLAACAAPAAASAPASAASGNDPIERLYERLSEKLGSVRQPTSDGSMLLKVPVRDAQAAHGTSRPAVKKEKKAEARGQAHGDWAYEGSAGPEAWARLKPDFATCGSGTRQSPIDLHDGFKVQLEPIEFAYQPGTFRVVDNGHTVQVNLASDNSIAVLGRRYRLKQFHFHRPSETRVAGRSFEMEAHLVHQDDEGRLAVLAVLFDRGNPNPAVQQVWNNLPLEKHEEQPARAVLDPAALLPEDRRYYTFMGSLTTPPCSEGVLWMVLKQPMALSPAQIELFARLYPNNARPVQPSAGRMVKESE
jgi:carbonic anhydrase